MSKIRVSRSRTAPIVGSRSVAMASALTAVVGLAGFGASSSGAAVTQYFDPGAAVSGTGSGGSGAWDTTTADWYVSGTTDSVYGAANASTFAGAAGTVTVGSNIINTGQITVTTIGDIFDLGNNTVTTSAQVNINAASGNVTLMSSGTTGGTFQVTGTALAITNAANAGLTVGPGATLDLENNTTGSAQAPSYRNNNGTGGALTVNGGTVISKGVITVGHGASTGTINLTSGQITPSYGFGSDSTATHAIINFGGATINTAQALSNLFNPSQELAGSDFTPASLALNDVGGGGGAIFNTTGGSLGLLNVIGHSAGNGTADGGLTKHGSNTITLSAANTYNGPTTVTDGTLIDANATSGVGTGSVFVTADSTAGAVFQLNAASDLTASQSLTLTDFTGAANSALANLNYGGTDIIAALVSNGVNLPAGIYGGSGSTGATTVVPFLTGTGTLTIAAVPEPASLGVVALGAIGLIRRRRRA